MKADLHIHSTASDGSCTPQEIVAQAVQSGMDAIALTDHDTIAGNNACAQACMQAGIGFVHGVELSACSTVEVHILGYAFDPTHDELLTRLQEFGRKRAERARKIVHRLQDFRIELDTDELCAIPNVGRMHIAKMMIARGYCASVNEAFDRYLGQNGKAYVPSGRIIPAHAVELITRAGGVAVLAHPARFLIGGKLDDLIGGLKPLGLRGLEAYYPSHDSQTVQRLQQIAARSGLFCTGGSDFHGSNRPNVTIGCVDFCPSGRCRRELRF